MKCSESSAKLFLKALPNLDKLVKFIKGFLIALFLIGKPNWYPNCKTKNQKTSNEFILKVKTQLKHKMLHELRIRSLNASPVWTVFFVFKTSKLFARSLAYLSIRICGSVWVMVSFNISVLIKASRTVTIWREGVVSPWMPQLCGLRLLKTIQNFLHRTCM